jgi:hypothetical protein
MCGLDYETILNPQQTPKNTKSLEDGAKDQEFVKAMKGPGGYFREPGGYIVDMLIFNPDSTTNKNQIMFPPHGASTPPASGHFALEIEKQDYEKAKNILILNKIEIEKELTWENEKIKIRLL